MHHISMTGEARMFEKCANCTKWMLNYLIIPYLAFIKEFSDDHDIYIVTIFVSVSIYLQSDSMGSFHSLAFVLY